MQRTICVCCIACCLAGCVPPRNAGPVADEVGKIFTWKMHSTVEVTDTGCPSQAKLEDLKRDLPGSHQFVRLDSLTAGTGLSCQNADDLKTCVEIDEATSIIFPRELAIANAHFTGSTYSIAAQLAAGCSLMVDSTFDLADKGNSATLTMGLVYRKQDVAACLGVQLVDGNGNVVQQCSADATGDLDLVSVRDAPR